MGIGYVKWFSCLLIVCLFGFIYPLVLTNGFIDTKIIIFYIIIFYSLFRLCYIIIGGTLKLLEMTFFIFTYLFMGLAALVQTYNNAFPWNGNYSDGHIIIAGLTVIIGMVCYDAGLLFANKNKSKMKPVENVSNIRLGLVVFAGLISFLIGVIGLGGIQNLGSPTGLDQTSSLIYNKLMTAPIFVALIYSLLVWVNRKRKSILIKSNFYLFCLIIMLITLNIIAANPMYTSRYWYGTVVIGTLFVFIKWRKLTLTTIIFAFLIGFLFVFPYADAYRYGEFNIETKNLEATLLNGDYDAFQQVMNSQKYTDMYGYSYGKQFLVSVLFWIPRSIWPDKPVGSGVTIGEGLGYNFTNISAPLWAEFNINFGMIGVILCFLLYGMITAKLQNNFMKTRGDINFYQIFVPVFSVYQLFLMRGDLLSTVAYLVPVIVCILLGLRVKLFQKRFVLRKA